MYGNIFAGYFLSEVMYHEKGRIILELREGKAKCQTQSEQAFETSPSGKAEGKKLFPGNTLTGEGFTEANKGVTSCFICDVLKDADVCGLCR